MPLALDQAPAAIASLPPERRLFHRRNRRKKASLPNDHRFPKFRPLPPRGAYESSRRAFCAPTKPTPAPRRRRRFGRADCARRRSKRKRNVSRLSAPRPFKPIPLRQTKRGPFGAVWSPAPVCHPIRMTSPAGQAGRRDAACSALKPGAALIVASTQQSEQPLKKAWHSSNCSKMHNNGIISSPICQNTPVNPKFCDLTAQGASGF